MKNYELNEVERQVINELLSKTKLKRNETDLLELYQLENPTDQDKEKFIFLLNVVVSLELNKREAKKLNDKMRDMYKAESPKERNKQLIQGGLDLVNIGLKDAKTGLYTIDPLVLQGFLLKHMQHLNDEQTKAGYIQIAQQHLQQK